MKMCCYCENKECKFLECGAECFFKEEKEECIEELYLKAKEEANGNN